MARRGQSRRNTQGKRPSQTIDLKASEVSADEASAGEGAGADVSGKDAGGAKVAAETAVDEKTADEKSADPKGADQESAIKESGGQKDSASASDKKDAASKDTAGKKEPKGGGSGGEPPLTGDKPAGKKSGSGGGGFFKLLAASLVGAVIALGGQQFMPRLVTTSETATLEGLQNEVSALKSAVEGVDAGASDKTLKKIAELETAVQAAQQAAKGEGDLEGRLGQLEQTLTDLSIVAKDDDAVAGVAAISTRVNSIEQRVDKALEGIRSDFSTKFRRELEQVSKEIAAQESLTQIEGVKLTASTLGKKLAQLDAQSQKLAQQMTALNETVTGVKSGAVTRDQVSQQIDGLKAELEKVTAKLADVTARENAAHEAARKSALALAFSNLKRAMGRGEGFSDELSAVKRLATEGIDFSALEPLANNGIPTEQGLMDDYSPLAVEALAKDQVGTDGSTWDKLVSKARTALKYRRTGDLEGSGNEAVLARMEHQFKQGHIEEVLSEAKALDGQAAQVMGPWLNKLEARLMVEKATQKIEDQLLATLEPR